MHYKPDDHSQVAAAPTFVGLDPATTFGNAVAPTDTDYFHINFLYCPGETLVLRLILI